MRHWEVDPDAGSCMVHNVVQPSLIALPQGGSTLLGMQDDAAFLTAPVHACRFALPHKQQLLGVPAGQHIKVRVTGHSGQALEQAFNPISTDDTPGEVTLLVKVPANVTLSPDLGCNAARYGPSSKLACHKEAQADLSRNSPFCPSMMASVGRTQHAAPVEALRWNDGASPLHASVQRILVGMGMAEDGWHVLHAHAGVRGGPPRGGDERGAAGAAAGQERAGQGPLRQLQVPAGQVQGYWCVLGGTSQPVRLCRGPCSMMQQRAVCKPEALLT